MLRRFDNIKLRKQYQKKKSDILHHRICRIIFPLKDTVTQKNDTQILAVTYEKLIAEEAYYSALCYLIYAIPTNEKLSTHLYR